MHLSAVLLALLLERLMVLLPIGNTLLNGSATNGYAFVDAVLLNKRSAREVILAKETKRAPISERGIRNHASAPGRTMGYGLLFGSNLERPWKPWGG